MKKQIEVKPVTAAADEKDHRNGPIIETVRSELPVEKIDPNRCQE